MIRRLIVPLTAVTVALGVVGEVGASVESDMTTPGGSSASVTITMTITTSFGTSSDTESRTMTTTGTAHAAFVPNSGPFNGAQFDAMQLSFADATYPFGFYCAPPFGCLVSLNVTVTGLQLQLVEPTCAVIGAGGAVSYPAAVVRMTGSYSTTGFATTSGSFDNTGPGAINGRITNPTSSSVRLDQVVLANQTIVVDPATLPAGVTALTIVIQPNMANTTLSGPFADSAINRDADNDGLLDYCDTCTDSDGDGYGDPGYVTNVCAVDNCPDEFNPDQTDTNDNGIGDACEAVPCPEDIAPPGGNGSVGVPDLLAVINAWGPCPNPNDCPADIAPPGGNDAVGVPDLLAIINAWGLCR